MRYETERNSEKGTSPEVRRDGGRGEERREGAAAGRRRPRLRLPFDDSRRKNIGFWAYVHRYGLLFTLVALIIAVTAMVVTRVPVGERQSAATIMIDLSEFEELEQERDRLQEEIEQRLREQTDWRAVRNWTSNENALNENLRDDRKTDISQLNKEAERIQQEMKDNQEEYRRKIDEINGIDRPQKDSPKSGDADSSAKVPGMVTVSYSFSNPVRHHRELDRPAYRCQGGGEVVVSVTLDRDGNVTAASVVSGGDYCMRETALQSARLSKFNSDSSAPAKHTGTITYIFIPQ